MNEENPLYFLPHRKCPTFNKSGRPTNEKSIKFSPQPSSLISEMLKKLKTDKIDTIDMACEDSAIITENEDDLQYEMPNDIKESKLKSKGHLLIGKPKTVKKLLYPCDYPKCTYISKLLSNLVKHKRTHTMEKPYLCDKCSFRSNFVNSLKVHKRIHTNERPYNCKYCSYRCNSSSNLKKHCKHRHWNDICQATTN